MMPWRGGRASRTVAPRLMASILDGATALLGVDGTAHGERERARFFSRNADVPMMVTAVGSGARIGAVLPELGTLLQRPLLTFERLRICKRDGQLLDRPDALPGWTSTAWPCGASSWFTPPRRPGTTASPSTAPSSAAFAAPASGWPATTCEAEAPAAGPEGTAAG